MKALKVLVIIFWAFGIQINSVQAQPFRVKTQKLIISGTSSLHDWESTVEKLECKGSFTLSNNSLSDLRDVVVKIPVTAIKSTKGKIMDNKTYDAFSHEKNPLITFTMTSKKIDTGKSSVDLSGTLAMAGVTRSIEMSLNYKLLPGGELQITGSKKLAMTDFKMEPPTAMMGTIKVGNEVLVSFEMVLSPNSTL